jgi:ABC-type nitrate/sulfonate/bicarbonate transport system substrate-binding protein
MTRVRLMTWCERSVGGMHLPAFAAAESGLFAEHGLDVELVPSSGLSSVPAGVADFALTSALHVLHAQAGAAEVLPLRFVAAFHQRNPIAGVVREDSGRRTPADLPGARAARWSIPWYAQEYAGVLVHMGYEPPRIVETPGSLDHALGSGTVDVLPMWMDQTMPSHGQGMVLHHAGEIYAIRTIALDIPVYSTGLVAADRMPEHVVLAMRDAIAAGHELQREQPELGIAAFRRCFPEISAQEVRTGWELYEPYAFDGVRPGSMNADRWRDTIRHISQTHDLPGLDEEQLVRPEALA